MTSRLARLTRLTRQSIIPHQTPNFNHCAFAPTIATRQLHTSVGVPTRVQPPAALAQINLGLECSVPESHVALSAALESRLLQLLAQCHQLKAQRPHIIGIGRFRRRLQKEVSIRLPFHIMSLCFSCADIQSNTRAARPC